jgi:hypothetical protein
VLRKDKQPITDELTVENEASTSGKATPVSVT